MKPKHQRFIFLTVSMAFLVVASLITLQAFRENLVFFYTPSELMKQSLPSGQLVRIGGLVEEGSVEQQEDRVAFRITDGVQVIQVHYQGMLPALFREGQGVVAEGYKQQDGMFGASRVLTKHDEKYMPKEVVDALKESGRWQEGQ